MATDAGAKVEAVEGFAQAITLVKQRRVDATVNDNLAVLEYLKTTSDTDVKIAAETGDTSEQVFALRHEDGELRDAINQALDELRADGTLPQISEKYFDTDVSTGEETATATERPGRGADHLGADQGPVGPMLLATIKGTIPLTSISFVARTGDRAGRGADAALVGQGGVPAGPLLHLGHPRHPAAGPAVPHLLRRCRSSA